MKTLDAKALRMLLSVVRCRSIRSAAEQEQVAASVVSRQISEIEKNIGLPLFTRTSRGVGLTDAGQLVVEHAQRVLEDSLLLSEQLDQFRSNQALPVKICCGEGFLGDLIENALSRFVHVYPTVSYHLRLGSTDIVQESVANGDVDLGIAYSPAIDPRIKSLAISRQPMCLIAPLGHPLLERKDLVLSQCLTGTHYALLDKGHGVAQLVSRVAVEAGLAVSPMLATPSIDALRRFVTAGLGVTFLPIFAVTAEIKQGLLGAVELNDPLLTEASSHLMVKARRRLPNTVERLGSFLASEMSAFRH